MKIETLHSIDEVLHYGSLGEVEIITGEDWLYLEYLIEKHSDLVEAEIVERNTPEDNSEEDWERGYEEGLVEGYGDCMKEYNLEDK